MRYAFGDCTLDTAQYILDRSDHAIALQPKVFQVLHYLLTHRERVIAKQELCDQVWPDRFISDAAIEGVIKAIRRAVGDNGRTQWCIQTRRGQGYRFVAPLVEPASISQEETPAAPPVCEPPDVSLPVSVAPVGDPSDVSRRQLTVLFCDLVDSTSLSEQLDPEELREVVLVYYAACREVIERFAGTIAQYLGDGLLVYFGYPHAHEDGARRAIHAGLGLLTAMHPLNDRLAQTHCVRLEVRVGIHTGLTVVGAMGDANTAAPMAIGDTPTIAARLQDVVAPNTVVISAATHRLTQGYFQCQPLGPHPLKGLTQPLSLYQVLHAGAAQSRLDVGRIRGLTPFVGREAEVSLLLERWRQVQDGRGQVVILSGEPGIGKSRLAQEFTACLPEGMYTLLAGRASPYYQQTACYPVTEIVAGLCHWHADDPPEAKVTKLAQTVSHYAPQHIDAVPFVASIVALPSPPPLVTTRPVTPHYRRQQALTTLLALVTALAADHPVLLLVEDVHWADPTTLAWLDALIAQGPTVALYTVVTCRPEFVPSWVGRAHVTHLTLGRLVPHEVEAMVDLVAAGRRLPTAVRAHLVTHSDGVPLFIEELTKGVLEAQLLQAHSEADATRDGLAISTIPQTLHDLLTARLDRLDMAKRVLQVGATIGRSFPYGLLRAVLPLDDDVLQHALGQTVAADLLYQRGLPPQATYQFKHALIQDAAYQTLLKRARQEIHQRIAQAVVSHFPELAATEPERLAQHYTAAGLSTQAIDAWLQAGWSALERAAYVEAVAHLQHGLDILRTLPDTPERSYQELRLQSLLGRALVSIKGFAAPEAEQVLARTYDLCASAGDTPQRFEALWNLWTAHLLRADLDRAHDLGQQCLTLAQSLNHEPLCLRAHFALGTTLLMRDALVMAQGHLEQGLTYYDRHLVSLRRAILDPGVGCLEYLAFVQWLKGHAAHAQTTMAKALHLAQEVSHPLSEAYALLHVAVLYQFQQQWRAVRAYAEEACTLATEQGFPYLAAAGRILQGWSLVAEGTLHGGMAHLQQGVMAYRATGVGLHLPYLLSLLADGYGRSHQIDAGLATLTEALARVEHTGERWWEAELHRLMGVLRWQQAGKQGGKAEACFQRALEVARSQNMTALELRAALSLSCLWHHNGKQEAARNLLVPIYGGFTEGFDTADLQEAQRLLDAVG